MKICTKCKSEKCDTSFRLRKKGRSIYLNSSCRSCDFLEYKKYRAENRDKVRETKRKWALKNKDKKVIYDKKYRLKMGKFLDIRKKELMRMKEKCKRLCIICNKEFFNYRISKFCSHKCHGIFMMTKRTGPLNPNHRHGNNEKIKEWDRARKLVINKRLKEFDYIQCERCLISLPNETFAFHLHHIVYRSEAPKHKNIHHPLNLLFVCPKCHSWFHGQKNRREYLIKDRQLWKLFPEYIKNTLTG